MEYITEKYKYEINNERTRQAILADIVQLFTPYIQDKVITKNINVSLKPSGSELKISITKDEDTDECKQEHDFC